MLLVLALLVNITGFGVPIVKMTVCGGTIYSNITLPVAAIPSTIIVVNKCTGAPVDFVPSSKYILVPETSCKCPLEIEYLAPLKPTSNLTFTISLNLSNMPSNLSAKIVYPSNVVLIPRETTGLVLLPNNTVLVKGGRSYNFEYILLTPLKVLHKPSVKAAPVKPKSNVSVPTAPSATTNKTTQVSAAKKAAQTAVATTGRALLPTWLIGAIVGLIVAVIAVTVVLLTLRKRYRSSASTAHSQVSQISEDLAKPIEETELRELDREIIRILKEAGGSILQRDLYRMLNVPKTTLWRAIRRLERLGFIKVEKLGRLNRIVLLRDF